MAVVRRIVVCGVEVLGGVILGRGWYSLLIYRGHEILLVLRLVKRKMVVEVEFRYYLVVVGGQRRVGRLVVGIFVDELLRLVFDWTLRRCWDLERRFFDVWGEALSLCFRLFYVFEEVCHR
jgi:hypothetical protein